MDKRHDDDAGRAAALPQQQRLRAPFAPFQAPSFQGPRALVLAELGRPPLGLPFSSPVGAFQQQQQASRPNDAHGANQNENENENQSSQDRLVETNSSLTPLDLHRPPNSRTGTSLLECSESTSGITPCSWASLYSAFKVPSLSSFEEEDVKSHSTARTVPLDARMHDVVDHRRADGMAGPPRPATSDGEGNQRVPVQNSVAGSGAGASPSPPKARHSFPAQSSQFSNSWQVGDSHRQARGGGGGGLVGSDRGSGTAFGERAMGRRATTSGQTIDRDSNSPIYAPQPSYANARASAGADRGKNKMADLSAMPVEHELDRMPMFRIAPTMAGLPIATGSSSRRELLLPHPSPGLGSQLHEAVSNMGMGAMRMPAAAAAAGMNEMGTGGKRCVVKEVAHSIQVQDQDQDRPQAMVGDYDQPLCDLATQRDSFKAGRQTTTAEACAAAAERAGQKQSRLRNLSDVADEPGTSGFIKRSRQHPHYSSWTFQAEKSDRLRPDQPREQSTGTGVRTESTQSCNWLQRWLPPKSIILGASAESPAAAAAAAAARSRARQWDGPDAHGRGNGNGSGMGSTPADIKSSCKSAADASMCEENGREWTRIQNRFMDFSSRELLYMDSTDQRFYDQVKDN
ncbi:hypothetical protein AXG93_2175s1750 [Marchantia polymorpha subsp. ruderalis]|uniref:Uncharacterized protein n=1 Tax=Marchantia polymorpha subsp. ruderalis TaxID=1480154 RepID=A0A176W7I6_MARPO|nr:hypothetical protein AXG93_2175s1750 [Marchantia polymorpha subsp. ruderalis]